MKRLIFGLMLMPALCLQGQELTSGDATVVDRIKKTTSFIYENKDETFFFLTNTQLEAANTHGTSLTAHLRDGFINRAITISLTSNGQLSSEFYFDDQQLIYVYQTFEFFAEAPSRSKWKNFKGISGWESRYYFINEELNFQKHLGKEILAKEGDIHALKESANAIRRYILENK
ncbi:MAG: hypothetical protein ABJG47_10130 [Ekhidna sp.]